MLILSVGSLNVSFDVETTPVGSIPKLVGTSCVSTSDISITALLLFIYRARPMTPATIRSEAAIPIYVINLLLILGAL